MYINSSFFVVLAPIVTPSLSNLLRAIGPCGASGFVNRSQPIMRIKKIITAKIAMRFIVNRNRPPSVLVLAGSLDPWIPEEPLLHLELRPITEHFLCLDNLVQLTYSAMSAAQPVNQIKCKRERKGQI